MSDEKERWVIYDRKDRLDCPCCGDDISILTTLSESEIEIGLYQDGDSVKCLSRGCDLANGQISCDSETEAYVNGDW